MTKKLHVVVLTLMGLLVVTAMVFSWVSLGLAHAQSTMQKSSRPRYTYLPLHKLGSTQAVNTRVAQDTNGLEIPNWSSSFTYNGQKYPYTMIGADPRTSSATTTIPVDIVPLIFTFSDGITLDGSTIVNNIVQSPMFQNNIYNTGDNTQYVDAVQRAEFWRSVSTRTQNYHLLLAHPTVQQAVTLTVPSDLGSTTTSSNGQTVGQVDYEWIHSKTDQLAISSTLSPAHLTIFASLNINVYESNLSLCCVGGYHTAVQNDDGSNYTYAYANYDQTGSVFFQDVVALSHELAEWANDPLGNNLVPGWFVPGKRQNGCNKTLEVGDPLGGSNFAIGSYHVQDEASFSWFAQEHPSQAFQGKYSFQGNFTGPAPTC